MPSESITRRKFIKLAGLSIFGSWLAACNPEPELFPAAPTRAPTNPAATHIPYPTATVLPASPVPPEPTTTATPTAAQTATLEFTPVPTVAATTADILTQSQRERLASTALKFQAGSEADAIQVARSLGYLVNDGHPASMCGPLSIAILRDAGLLSPYVDLHEFWLLNPREGNAVLERTFPKEDFTWFQTDQSTAEFDFTSFPLAPGDFMYLFAGDPGSFEHMLVVSRVDASGRAYAVTNFDTPDGYRIQEVMLYDPDESGLGKFYDWTNRKFAKIGMTGFGGFLLWRFKTPVRDKSLLEQQFGQEIDRIIDESGGTWRIYIREIDGPVLYARQERKTLHTASTIKVPISMLFFKSLEKIGVKDVEHYLQKGVDGRSYQQLLDYMLIDSEEDATASFENVILENRLDEQKTLQEWGAPHTYIKIRQSTALDMANLLEGLFTRRCIDEIPSQIILKNLQTYTPGDDFRLGTIRKFIPPEYPFYNKRGTITDGFLVVSDSAIIKIPTSQGDKVYIACVFAYQGEMTTSFTQLEVAIGKLAVSLWQYTQAI